MRQYVTINLVMDYSKSLLLYQDQPAYGIFLKLIIGVIPLTLLVISIFLLSSGNRPDGLALLFETFFIGAIFWVVFPRKYQVFEDHLRIVLGGPLSVKVGFEKIQTVGIRKRFTPSINLVTRMTSTYVEIARKTGMSIAITPGDSDLFTEKANQALRQWEGQKKVKA